jgi:hypothetical protein
MFWTHLDMTQDLVGQILVQDWALDCELVSLLLQINLHLVLQLLAGAMDLENADSFLVEQLQRKRLTRICTVAALGRKAGSCEKKGKRETVKGAKEIERGKEKKRWGEKKRQMKKRDLKKEKELEWEKRREENQIRRRRERGGKGEREKEGRINRK